MLSSTIVLFSIIVLSSMTGASDMMESGEDLTTSSTMANLLPQGLISDEVLAWAYEISRPLTLVLCCLGILGNTVNFIVYLRQDLTIPSNIGFLWLAVADLCSLISGLTYIYMSTPEFFVTRIAELRMTATLFIYFVNVDNIIVFALTIERCLCVVFPFRVKQIVTAKVMKVAVAATYTLVLWYHIPVWASVTLYKKYFDPTTNTTWIGSGQRSFVKITDDMAFYGAAISRPLYIIGIFIFTMIMVFHLRRYLGERKNITRGQSSRENNAIRMVLALAVCVLILSIPYTASTLILAIELAYDFTGQYNKLTQLFGILTTVCESLNMSINILIFYTMGTKYRNSLHLLIYQITGKCGDKAMSPSDSQTHVKPNQINSTHLSMNNQKSHIEYPEADLSVFD